MVKEQPGANALVAANVRLLRKGRGWTLEQLSEKLTELGYPVSLQVLWKTENDKRQVSADDLLALSRVFGVTVDRLLATRELPGEIGSLLAQLENLDRTHQEVHARVKEAEEHLLALSRERSWIASTRTMIERTIQQEIEKAGIEVSEVMDVVSEQYGPAHANRVIGTFF